MADRACDIVLEGGGVKGTGLVGALYEVTKAGYVPRRVAGTSAGAIVGALVAAGMPVNDMTNIMRELDYTKFRDEGLLDKLNIPGKTASFVFEKGIYEGNYLREWLTGLLEGFGVRTFADLRLTDEWAKKLPPERRYKLVVIVSDVSRGRIVRLPWDYASYGLDPDEQLVADAVRASMSIPFFYEPVNLKGNYLVDGGLLSNFPVAIFDDHTPWPTFGIKLSARAEAISKMNPVTNPVDYGMAILSTAINAHDAMHIDDSCTQMRTIFVDTFDIKATDFDISKEDQAKLFESGRHHGKTFFQKWDFADYKKFCEKK
ncbi:MAG TPA: patatin-like phospholipase family protein [Candidatus Saccharimonadales bacterium]|nr:patatin-like phospholipase family protein [Candidatus Saccharimonadales bacterium]